MANFYSDQLTNLEKTTPPVWLKPADLKGRVRIAYFTYTTPAAAAPGVGDFVALTKLPANARIIDMTLVWGALSTGAGTAGADIGPADDIVGTNFANDYVAALNMDAAGNQRLVPVLDKLPNSTLYSAAKYVIAKVTGEAWAVSTKVQGWLTFVLD